LIVALDPAGPCSFHLHRGQLVELGRKRALQLGQNRARLAETNESGWSDGVRRAGGDKQQDADSPDVGVRNGPILHDNSLVFGGIGDAIPDGTGRFLRAGARWSLQHKRAAVLTVFAHAIAA
jgi:hypothetical protein